MANFNGFQSLNGLQNTTLFTAPSAGYYFVQSNLSIPQIGTSGSASAVVCVVKKNNSSTLYTGGAGDMGFAINQITLAAGDYVNVILSSAAACDQVSNAVSGQVAYGNTF